MQDIRDKFPVLKQSIYANTAATGLLNEDLLEWRQEHDLDYLIGGSLMKEKSFEQMFLVRESVGRFFKCVPQNVALVQNFSLGLNLLLEGLPKDQNVLLLKDDYPSLNWPFETRDFKREYVEINAQLEENIYNEVKSGKFNVLALSLVQWISGVKIDLDFLKKLKTEFEDLLIIADGTQFCGTQRFDFEDSGIDVLGASAYKWLLAGYGNGFVLVKDEAKKRFDVKSIGNNSVDRDITKRDDIPFCKRLEPGHLDSLNFGSLKFSLEFLEQIGMQNIEEQLKKLGLMAKKGFQELGLLDELVQLREEHSTIFNIKGDGRLFDKLQQNDVVCVQRGEGIRLSFHFYNTENEIKTIMDILRS
ncbi:aminotransferase class V-fold PLP-dependent enzyme [Flagellimonas allohymeniacidonis]|uniref:Aminotransferase class V-fold PLP-dependent enzyme n=1 Tax=Flagellimonas allohymeniacidonis TaxID=2517819 RepID=A0A4Q8QFT5_9FLAO|nr:aminotransferase class V-fold PLP-dependent enzyme [Allomuricauda hymeniacidonis]TAI46966.1 aminotransferase class V-fold PLP-dependent enzyme [Allomuricauda hymeniacidonis]